MIKSEGVRDFGWGLLTLGIFFLFISVAVPHAELARTVAAFLVAAILSVGGIITLTLSSILAQLETITTDADKEREADNKKQKADSYGVATGAERHEKP